MIPDKLTVDLVLTLCKEVGMVNAVVKWNNDNTVTIHYRMKPQGRNHLIDLGLDTASFREEFLKEFDLEREFNDRMFGKENA